MKLDRKGHKVLLEHKGHREMLVDPKEIKVRRDHRVRKAIKAQPGHKDHRERKVPMDTKAWMVMMGFKAHRATKDRKAQTQLFPALKDRRVTKGRRGIRAHKVSRHRFKARKAIKARKG